jgi:hypothetical protein
MAEAKVPSQLKVELVPKSRKQDIEPRGVMFAGFVTRSRISALCRVAAKIMGVTETEKSEDL